MSFDFDPLKPPPNPVDAARRAAEAARDAAAAAAKATQQAKDAAERHAREVTAASLKAAEEARHAAERLQAIHAKAAADALAATQKAAADALAATQKAEANSRANLYKSVDDLGRNLSKAGQDTGNTVVKAVTDVGQAVSAIVRYVERETKSAGERVKTAAERAREGKFVDALWHFGTEALQDTEEHLFDATQESELLAAAGQVAATAYGGPAGAAAYAAWRTYKQTGSFEVALRAGIITGLAGSAMGAAAEMPEASLPQLVQKTIVTGAIGGAAVAAAGGDDNAVRDGFLEAGGMVLVQDAYAGMTEGHKIDARASSGDPPYCMATVGAECSPNLEAYELGPDGKPVLDENGLPKVDINKTDIRRSHVGTWATSEDPSFVGASERSGAMIAASKIPGVNAMSIFHDNWVVSWNMNTFTSVATIAPAIVMTYTGVGEPFFDLLQKTAAARKSGKPAVKRKVVEDKSRPPVKP